MNVKPPGRLISAGFAMALLAASAVVPGQQAEEADPLPSVAEARERAKLLHGVVHDTLQLIHARFYRENEGQLIPAAGMEHIFDELEERDGVQLDWLVVEGKAMNIDHEPRDEFEKQAAKALAAGESHHEATTADAYRFAGPITLGAECLKCHLPSRSSNKSRTAGLLISIPVGKE